MILQESPYKLLYGLTDSDFAGCKDMARSTSGCMVLMNDGVAASYSGRHSTVALYTAMTETIAQRNLRLLSKLSICEHVCLICNADKSRTQ